MCGWVEERESVHVRVRRVSHGAILWPTRSQGSTFRFSHRRHPLVRRAGKSLCDWGTEELPLSLA